MEEDLVAMARRALADDPRDALLGVRQLHEELGWLELRAVRLARRARWPWARIARALGRTRQAVHRRYAGYDLEWRRRPVDAQTREQERLGRLLADVNRELAAEGDDDPVAW